MSTFLDAPDYVTPSGMSQILAAALAEITDAGGMVTSTVTVPQGTVSIGWDTLVGDANNGLVFSIVGVTSNHTYVNVNQGPPVARQQGSAAVVGGDTSFTVKFSTPSANHPLFLNLYANGPFILSVQAPANAYTTSTHTTPAGGGYDVALAANQARKGLLIHNLGAATLSVSFDGVNEADIVPQAPAAAWRMPTPIYTGAVQCKGASGGVGLAVVLVEIT